MQLNIRNTLRTIICFLFLFTQSAHSSETKGAFKTQYIRAKISFISSFAIKKMIRLYHWCTKFTITIQGTSNRLSWLCPTFLRSFFYSPGPLRPEKDFTPCINALMDIISLRTTMDINTLQTNFEQSCDVLQKQDNKDFVRTFLQQQKFADKRQEFGKKSLESAQKSLLPAYCLQFLLQEQYVDTWLSSKVTQKYLNHDTLEHFLEHCSSPQVCTMLLDTSESEVAMSALQEAIENLSKKQQYYSLYRLWQGVTKCTTLHDVQKTAITQSIFAAKNCKESFGLTILNPDNFKEACPDEALMITQQSIKKLLRLLPTSSTVKTRNDWVWFALRKLGLTHEPNNNYFQKDQEVCDVIFEAAKYLKNESLRFYQTHVCTNKCFTDKPVIYVDNYASKSGVPVCIGCLAFNEHGKLPIENLHYSLLAFATKYLTRKQAKAVRPTAQICYCCPALINLSPPH
jgi:hypothetical protein